MAYEFSEDEKEKLKKHYPAMHEKCDEINDLIDEGNKEALIKQSEEYDKKLARIAVVIRDQERTREEYAAILQLQDEILSDEGEPGNEADMAWQFDNIKEKCIAVSDVLSTMEATIGALERLSELFERLQKPTKEAQEVDQKEVAQKEVGESSTASKREKKNQKMLEDLFREAEDASGSFS